MSVYIIGEAGVNHNGSLDIAKKLVDVAVAAGVDAIKFQTFRSEKLVIASAPKANYQKKTTNEAESQLSMLKKLELDEQSHQILFAYCEQKGIQFLSTPFDSESLKMLVSKLKLPRIKIGSGEITNAPLLYEVALTAKPVILSTGMSSLGEVEQALGVLALGYLSNQKAPSITAFQSAWSSKEGQQVLQEKVVLLHCTTEYPAPFSSVNLKAMDTMKEAFGLPVGFSDHTQGIEIALAAVARGAVVIEKHFTLDCTLPGPDHQASLEPESLRNLVKGIRNIEAALGRGIKAPDGVELKNKKIARKSLVTQGAVVQGEEFTTENLAIKRPGTGISPLHYWEWLGKKASKNYAADQIIDA
ncbi:N-acetylneuraminate synthase [Deltaproteobacteria bacterium TL4]